MSHRPNEECRSSNTDGDNESTSHCTKGRMLTGFKSTNLCPSMHYSLACTHISASSWLAGDSADILLTAVHIRQTIVALCFLSSCLVSILKCPLHCILPGK